MNEWIDYFATPRNVPGCLGSLVHIVISIFILLVVSVEGCMTIDRMFVRFVNVHIRAVRRVGRPVGSDTNTLWLYSHKYNTTQSASFSSLPFVSFSFALTLSACCSGTKHTHKHAWKYLVLSYSYTMVRMNIEKYIHSIAMLIGYHITRRYAIDGYIFSLWILSWHHIIKSQYIYNKI